MEEDTQPELVDEDARPVIDAVVVSVRQHPHLSEGAGETSISTAAG